MPTGVITSDLQEQDCGTVAKPNLEGLSSRKQLPDGTKMLQPQKNSGLLKDCKIGIGIEGLLVSQGKTAPEAEPSDSSREATKRLPSCLEASCMAFHALPRVRIIFSGCMSAELQ